MSDVRRWIPALLLILLLLSACSSPEPATEPIQSTESGEIFSLDCGETVLNIVCPAGWTGKNSSPTNAAIYSEDYTLTGDYYYYPDQFTWEDVLNLANINAGYLKSADLFVSQGAGPVVDGYQTWALIGNGQSYYYALGAVGNGVLMVGVYDFSGTDDAAVLLPLFLALIAEAPSA